MTPLLIVLIILVVVLLITSRSGAISGEIVNVLWVVLLILAIVWLVRALGLL